MSVYRKKLVYDYYVSQLRYRANFLDSVICGMLFKDSDSINDTSLRDFKDRLGENYKNLSAVTQQGFLIQGGSTGIEAEKSQRTLWTIDSADDSHRIEIQVGGLAVIFTKYDDYSNFESIVTDIIHNFFATFNSIISIDRLGLRYINKIHPREADFSGKWSDYILKSITTAHSFIDNDHLRRSMQAIISQQDDDTYVNFNFGIFNSYFPSPIVENEFILDIDVYTAFAITSDIIFEKLKYYNEVATVYFEKLITQKLRDEMEVIDE